MEHPRLASAWRVRVACAAVTSLAVNVTASAQCTTSWSTDFTVPSPSAAVWSIGKWDRDGAGPQQAVLVAGVPSVGLCWWDAANGGWVAIPGAQYTTASTLRVDAVASLPNGDLVVGGSFSSIGGIGANNIARWDGTSWHALGAGTNTPAGPGGVGVVSCLAVDGAGAVLAGGYFTMAGGISASGLARWNGTSWQALGLTTPGWNVTDIAVLPNGNVVVAGLVPNGISRWNGSVWSSFGSGPNSGVLALCVLANGDLVAGGGFSQMDGVTVNGIGRWNGTSWAPFGSGMSNAVSAIAEMPNGDVMIGGAFQFTATGIPMNYVARWDGSAWSALGGGINAPTESLLAMPNGEVVVRGSVPGVTTPEHQIARWNGAGWLPLPVVMSVPSGPNDAVEALAELPNGDVIASGHFREVGGVSALRVARWTGTAWSPLGTGVDSFPFRLATLPNGDLVAGGPFATAGGVTTNNIARWNGSTWSSLGTGMNSATTALHVLASGDLIVGGYFTSAGGVSASKIARWNGVAWSPLGTGLTGTTTYVTVSAVATLPDGDIVAAGTFGSAGGVPANNIARWDVATASWSAMGTGMNGWVHALQVSPDGTLIAGGEFTTAGGTLAPHVARWNGTSWSSLGLGVNGRVWAIAQLADGDIAVGGEFTSASGVAANNLARWNGASWSAIEAGTNGRVTTLLARSNGDLLVGGQFTTAGGGASYCLAIRSTSCPATVTAFGSGCSNGQNVLTLATSDRPWIGSTFEATGTGFGPNSLALSVVGFTAFAPGLVPLASLPIPGGGVGCDLLTAIDITDFARLAGGQANYSLFLPDSNPSLPGLVVHLQLVELDFSAGWIGTYSTNGLVYSTGWL